ncbi:hypothetical protein FH972_017341 [Carpinus fangiana]|uniref:Uncharacterized protein n=1 Tax=Carpinus fangiana TaxID=176857 RepID=A0A5N6RIM7_9ROSI|nr:hypothetical protein FH972_017341 [Carpinus fangiana]
MDFPRKQSPFRSSYAYSKLEDREEKTRFLIFKILEQADSQKGSSCLKIRICVLKVEIGKRLRKLKKCISCRYI